MLTRGSAFFVNFCLYTEISPDPNRFQIQITVAHPSNSVTQISPPVTTHTDTPPQTPKPHVLNLQTLPENFDTEAFAQAIEALEAEAEAAHPAEKAGIDLVIFGTLSFICTAVGWTLAIGGVNLGAIAALALANFSRWIFAHHVCHGAYDRTKNLPSFVHSRHFGKGGWRWLHWLDWMPPDAWAYEHNGLHHYQLNQPGGDPDLVEGKTTWLRSTNYPNAIKVILAILGGCFWKPMYYGPNTLIELWNSQRPDQPALSIESDQIWRPWHKPFWSVLRYSWLPYTIGQFVVPSLVVYAIWGSAASLGLIVNLIAAELLTNIYSFFVIVSNHSGVDLYRFEGKPRSKGEFYWRQITGSCNYYTGTWALDFTQGWLNYQIEHHVWPRMTLSQYRWVQPRVKALCDEWNIPYVQASLWTRSIAMLKVVSGQY